jgi:pantoate--beta-alanine ligase
MGALHEGHLSLFRRAREESTCVVASVFVNPTQFNDAADLERYPRDLERDRELLEQVGVDVILAPSFDAIYPDEYRFRVVESETSRVLEGADRPGHFEGVLTVVMRLLNLVRPRRAYFGEKDWQQLLLVRSMVDAFFMDVEVVPCPIVRAPDGVALSSRNALLDQQSRMKAAEFARLLAEGPDADAVQSALSAAGIEVDYVEERWGRRLAAVRIGGVRLIDNVPAG